MTDNLSDADRKKTMRAVKASRTGPERKLAALFAAFRIRGWKRNSRSVLGAPDFAFPEERIAVFVDGCFWHGCPHCNRKLPVNNRKYWRRKIERNSRLARSYNRRLRTSGWQVIRIWEHEMRDRSKLIVRLKQIQRLIECNERKT